jgi:hypothetical protein
MRNALTIVAAMTVVTTASATVFLNEIFINPPGSYDDSREFIELMGTPGMKLDGYAVAFVSGGQTKYHELGSVTPGSRPEFPEVDELFSLDGLALGPNGLLVIGIDIPARYPTLLADANYQEWDFIWNGGLDTPGKLQNDGSNTIFLVRQRPGTTEADPNNPGGLRWGKDIAPDSELYTPVEDFVCESGPLAGRPCDPGCTNNCCLGAPCVPGLVDQYGNGAIDKGEPDNMGGLTLDLRGFQTPGDVTDDLEIVDEISYEHDKGWEYDIDSRLVDVDSGDGGLPERKVHSLDDPQGFNPDALARVDYRTKGDGWDPSGGGTGQMSNGNNWQDMATEQWIRGESIDNLTMGEGDPPYFHFHNLDNDNPDAIQPYETNVPLWLDDDVAPDYDFSALRTYQIMAGRLNPLAMPFIPGDVDRDGDCDLDDVDKLAAVFGNEDWVFSNSFADAPEGKDGDPATQTRPWDVDGTGDNGIEASDLQWVLNFQGDTTGQIVGRQYTSPTPAATGVHLNANVGVDVAITWTVAVPSGRPLGDLRYGDAIELTVSAALAGGANLTPAQENGVMQYVHDLLLDVPGVARVMDMTPLNGFATTNPGAEMPLGVDGDAGRALINGYTTAFDAGLAGPLPMYRATLRAAGAGTTALTLTPSAVANMAASTPLGVKVGHTDTNGDPETASYPASTALTATGPGDADGNGVLDGTDFASLLDCISGPETDAGVDCQVHNIELDGADVDLHDVALWMQLVSGR